MCCISSICSTRVPDIRPEMICLSWYIDYALRARLSPEMSQNSKDQSYSLSDVKIIDQDRYVNAQTHGYKRIESTETAGL